MKKDNAETKIESGFRKQVKKDKRVRNAYLLIHSDKLKVHLNIAEGQMGDLPADSQQPNYMASVGKIFTSTLTGILADEGRLSFDDTIDKYLDEELVNGLHVYEGVEYSSEIKIRHLLGQRSGLDDNFWPLLEKLIDNPNYSISPKDAINWVKTNTVAKFRPGEGFRYTDTNYHLLGLIIESIAGKSFHDALHEYFFEPLGMKHSYMLHYSDPIEKPAHPTADFFLRETRMNDIRGYAALDYAGGGVVGPLEDFLKFMKALVAHELVSEGTLQTMRENSSKFSMGIDYGYGIWQIKTVPLLMPRKFNSWGVAGVTGAFMFYHPENETFIIGNFNNSAYERIGLRFMMVNVMNKLF